jgi:hypothetical protein
MKRALIPLGVGTALAWAIASGQTLRQAASAVGTLLQLSGSAVSAASGRVSEHELEEINAMAPQEQAERLLERAINHYAGATEEILKRADGWTGKIHTSERLETMSSAAYFSSDLRVRAVALEIWRARDNFQKTSEAVDDLIREVDAHSDKKYFRLSSLGILGNRGVEPEKVFNTLMLYLHDPDGETRSGAINGLGLLGTENTIAPLLSVLRNDTSFDLRERAACNLSDSGMLSLELRRLAVPELVSFSQDPNLDATTKKWVFQALREITQQNLANDPVVWANWLGAQASRLPR